MDTSESAAKSETIALVKRAQGGDQDAYTQLFNEFHQPVLGYVYHTLHDRHAAEDVAQEAFIKAHERLGQLGPPWDFKSWVFRIASNLAIDYLRSGKRIVNVEDDVMAYLDDPPSTRRPYERRLQREEQKQQVWSSLEGLPTHYRQALILREFNDLSYQEVAQALEVSYDNARQIVHRARTKFQEVHGLRMVVSQAADRCRQLGDLLSAYHDGELDGAQADKVQQHLQTCDQCQQEKEEMKAAGLLLAGLPPLTATEAWKAAVLEAIRTRAAAGQSAAEAPQPIEAAGEAASAGGGGTGGGGTALASMMGGAAPWLVGGLLLMAAGAVAGFLAFSPFPFGPPATSSPTPYVLAPIEDATEPATAVAQEMLSASPSPSLGPVLEATSVPTATATPTLGPAMATALQNSNCRTGPSAEQFPSAADLLQGVTVPIDGRNSADTYWWVEQPDGIGHCYIWKELVEATGDLASVPFVPDPPTPTPADETEPQVRVSHSPTGANRPNNYDAITFSAQASDASGIDRLEIWVKGPNDNVAQLVQSCQNTTSCQVTAGPYNGGEVQYFARAIDGADNQGQTGTIIITITYVPG